MDRDTQRVQFAIPVVIVVLLVIGAVAVLGWGQLSSPLPAANPTSVPTGVAGATTPTAAATDFAGGAPTATLVSSAGAGIPTQPAAPPATTAPATTAPAPPATTAPAATIVPAPPTATTAPAPPPNTPVPAAPSNTPVPAGPPVATLAPGQTLQQVAQAHNVALGVLMAYNDIHNPVDVAANQTVKIPPADYKPTELQYTIRSGDNLTHIAQLFNVSISAITQRNGMSNPNSIFAGQNIIVPLQ